MEGFIKSMFESCCGGMKPDPETMRAMRERMRETGCCCGGAEPDREPKGDKAEPACHAPATDTGEV